MGITFKCNLRGHSNEIMKERGVHSEGKWTRFIFHIKFVEAMLSLFQTDKSMFIRTNEMLNEG